MSKPQTDEKIDWSEIFDKEYFVEGLVDPETLTGLERCYFIDSLYKDYVFYKDQDYESSFLNLYETALSYMVAMYGH